MTRPQAPRFDRFGPDLMPDYTDRDYWRDALRLPSGERVADAESLAPDAPPPRRKPRRKRRRPRP